MNYNLLQAICATPAKSGRRFLRGVFNLLSQFRWHGNMIHLNAADLEWWHAFAGTWNGVSMIVDVSLPSPEVEVQSDASGSWRCGTLWGREWLQVAWADCRWYEATPIAAKELLPIVLSVVVWDTQWLGQRVLFHCDNEAVVAALKGDYSRDSDMAHLLRCLFFLEARHELAITAVHVPGVENGAADSDSRNNLKRFFSLNLQAACHPTPVSSRLVDHLTRRDPWTAVDWRNWLELLLKSP